MINPIGVETARTPSLTPFTGAARTFSRTISISRASVGRDGFDFTVKPSVTETVSLPGPYTPLLPAWMAASSGLVPCETFTGDLVQTLRGPLDIYSDGIGYSQTIHPHWDEALKGYAYPISLAAGVNTIHIEFGGLALKVGFKFLAGGVWLPIAASLLQSYDQPLLGPFDAFALCVSYPLSSTFTVRMWQPVAATIPTVNGGGLETYGIVTTDAVDLARVREYRVTAMSVLCKNVSNVIAKGGTIAAARVPPGYSYKDSAGGAGHYSELAKLTDNAYHGALEQGAYVWWLPATMDELDPHPIGGDRLTTNLKVAGVFGDAAEVLEITVVMVVEFYSPLQIFEKVQGPVLLDSFVRGFAMLEAMPAAMCNPGHESFVERIKSLALTAGKAAGTWALENPEEATGYAVTLLSLLLSLA